MAVAQPRRYRARRFHLHHAREGGEFVYRAPLDRLEEAHRQVLALDDVELHLEQFVHRVHHRPAHDHDRPGGGDADDRQNRAHRPPRQVPQHHPRRLRQPSSGAEPLEQGHPEVLGWRRAHRLGGRQRDNAAHRAQRTHGRGGKTHPDGDQNARYRHLVDQQRKAEVLHVDAEHRFGQQQAGYDPDQGAEGHHDDGPLHVVNAEPEVRVAESLQRGDLFALHGDRAPQNHVEQERGDGEEDQGHEEPHGLKLGQLVLEVPVRRLIRARNRAQTAVGIEQRVEFEDRRPLEAGRAVRQCEGDVVEPALHLERGGQVPPGHPQEAEVLGIRDHFSRADAVYKLRAERDADDLQRLPATVDDREHTIAQVQAVSYREALTDQRLLRPVRVQEPPAAQSDVIQRRPAPLGQGDQASVDRIADSGHVWTFPTPGIAAIRCSTQFGTRLAPANTSAKA